MVKYSKITELVVGCRVKVVKEIDCETLINKEGILIRINPYGLFKYQTKIDGSEICFNRDELELI